MTIDGKKISFRTRIQNQELIRRIYVLRDWEKALELNPFAAQEMGLDFNLAWVRKELAHSELLILAAELLNSK